MFFENDEELINNFHRNSGHSPNSVKAYRVVFNKYRDYHQMSLHSLLKEAIFEQESNVPEHKLKIYDRIMDFRNFLVKRHIGNTITNSISKIKTFYRYNRVYLPFIPPLNVKNIKKNPPIAFDELLTKEDFRNALALADDDLGLWILVMLSSGATRREAKSMTNETLFRGTYAYHRKDDFGDAMEYLASSDNVICTCKLVRSKTDTPYYTFLNPECVRKIAEVKIRHVDFDFKSCLLKYNLNHVNHKCRRINDELGLGNVGGFSKFRPHMIRKFHATQLNQGSLESGLAMDLVDMLHGRIKSRTRNAYFKDNPDYLKLKYVQVMNNISLYHTYGWEIRDGEITVKVLK